MAVILTTADAHYNHNNGIYLYFINFLNYSAFAFSTKIRMHSE